MEFEIGPVEPAWVRNVEGAFLSEFHHALIEVMDSLRLGQLEGENTLTISVQVNTLVFRSPDGN